MGDLDEYDPELVALARWLSAKILRDGIEGIHYMETARVWADEHAANVVAHHISKELRKL
jgi:hypothetical protein